MILISPTPLLPLKPGSASRPLPTIEADVVDKDGNAVPPGKGGFLIIRHPWPAQMRTIFADPARYQTYWETIEGSILPVMLRIRTVMAICAFRAAWMT